MATFSRRGWLRRACLASAAFIYPLPRGLGTEIIPIEEHISDPDAPAEALSFDPAQAERAFRIFSRGPKKNPEQFAKRLLAISAAIADRGVSRESAPAEVETFLQLFDLRLRQDGTGPYVPYCAAGLSFAACRAYCEIDPPNSYDEADPLPVLKTILTDINKHYFKPSPAVRFIKAAAEQQGTWVSPRSQKPKAGWPVVFSWKRDGTPNHIGLVNRISGNLLHTVEFNTASGEAGSQSNGGAVARRRRKLEYVLGYVKIW